MQQTKISEDGLVDAYRGTAWTKNELCGLPREWREVLWYKVYLQHLFHPKENVFNECELNCV